MSTSSKASDWKIAPGWKMASYGCGYLIITFLLGNYTAYVFYFYEVEMGIPVILVGIAMVIFAIWNMINDPLLGYFTDRPFNIRIGSTICINHVIEYVRHYSPFIPGDIPNSLRIMS